MSGPSRDLVALNERNVREAMARGQVLGVDMGAAPIPCPVDGLAMRRVMGPSEWLPPVPNARAVNQHGQPCVTLRMLRRDRTGTIMVSAGDFDGQEWIHASMSRQGRVPDYEELKLLHRAVFGEGYAYHVFAPSARHVNDHDFVLHLWGQAGGANVLPDFAQYGSV